MADYICGCKKPTNTTKGKHCASHTNEEFLAMESARLDAKRKADMLAQ